MYILLICTFCIARSLAKGTLALKLNSALSPSNYKGSEGLKRPPRFLASIIVPSLE